MARSDERAVKERRLAREAAAQRRDEEFLAEKRRTHAETVAKIARLRKQRIAAVEKEDGSPDGSRRPARKDL